MKHARTASRVAGFSLIELMIALVAGLIVIGSVLAFTVSTVRAYNENIRSMRLTQDLRTAMNLAVREARRSGYDASSVTRVLTDNNPSPSFSGIGISADGDCFTYQYDRNDADEFRGLRLNKVSGTLQAKVAASAFDCSDTSGWNDVSDPAVVNITNLLVDEREAPFCVRFASRTVEISGVPTTLYDKAEGSVRNISLCMKGNLRADPTLVRFITDSSRSRTENVVFSHDVATDCPAISAMTPEALDSPSQMNSKCGAL